MTTLTEWFSGAAAESLFWSLLHSLWQGLIWSLLLALLLSILPKSKPNARYSASLICLFGLAVSVLITWSIMRLPAEQFEMATNSAVESSVVQEPLSDEHETAVAAATTSSLTKSAHSQSSSDSTQQTLTFSWGNWATRLAQRFHPLLLSIWICGVALSLIRCLTNRSAAIAWRKGEPIIDPAVIEVLSELKQRLRIRRPVQLIASLQAAGPCVIGTISPAILIPASLITGMTPDHWRAVLTHELAHVRRWDDLVNFTQQVLESLLFFNPAVWWISRQVRIEREACCDAWGAKLTNSPVNYARALVDIAEKITTHSPAPLLAFADERAGTLMNRIRRLISPENSRGGRLTWPMSIALLVMVLMTFVLLQKGSDIAVFTAAKFLSDEQRVTEITKVAEEISPQFTYTDEPLMISGKVTTEDGGPLPEYINITSVTRNGNGGYVSTEEAIRSEITNEFQVKARPGVTRLLFQGKGYASEIAGPFSSGKSSEAENVSVVLKRGVPVIVEVTDKNAQPVPEANISVLTVTDGGGTGHLSGLKTDQQGQLVVQNINPQLTYSIYVTAPGFQKLEVPARILSPDKPHQLQVIRSQTVTARVIGPDSSPLEGATVESLRQRSANVTNSLGRGTVIATSNPQGELVLDQLLDNYVYDFLIKHPDYAFTVLRNVRPGDKDLTVQMQKGFSVSGVVRGTPEQLERLSKTYHSYRLYQADLPSPEAQELSFHTNLKLIPTKDEAPFQIDQLPLGKLILTIDGQRIEQEVTASISDFVINLKDPEPIAERKVEFIFVKDDETVSPEGRLTISSLNTINDNPHHTYTQDYRNVGLLNGKAEISLPAPSQIRVEPRDFIGFKMIDRIFQAEIPEGNDTHIIRIPVEPAGAIRGVVLNTDGSPAQEINVYVSTNVSQRQGSTWTETMSGESARTNSAGEFLISPIPFGAKCELRASRDKHFVFGPTFTMMESQSLQNYTLQFTKPVSASVRVLDPQGNPLSNIPFIIRCEHARLNMGWGQHQFTDNNGELTLAEINPVMVSSFYVIVTPTKYYRNATVTLQAGKTVDVKLERGLFIEGKLTSKSGIPLSGRKLTAGAGELYGLPQSKYFAESVTDEQGHFRFSNLPAEEVRILLDEWIETEDGKRFMPSPENQIQPITITTGN